MDNPDSFLSRLQQEKLAAQERRGKLIAQKLAWASGLVAVGSVRSVAGLNLELWTVLFIVPFVAVVFDLYIAGENFGIKRMGVFVREHLNGTVDSAWEDYVGSKRDMFSWYALPLGTAIVMMACALTIWFGNGGAPGTRVPAELFWSWLAAVSGTVAIVHAVDSVRMSRLHAHSAEDAPSPPA